MSSSQDQLLPGGDAEDKIPTLCLGCLTESELYLEIKGRGTVQKSACKICGNTECLALNRPDYPGGSLV
jgi:hypothetical protein